MEAKADAVTAVLPDHGEAVRLHVMLNRVADITQARAWADFLDSQPHALIRDTRESLGQDLAFADEKHAARIAVIAVFDDGNIDIYHIAILEHALTRNTLSDDMVDGGAD